MSDLHVCSPCYYPDGSNAALLEQSAAKHGMRVSLFGIGQPWGGFVESKMVGLRNHLGTVKEKYTLCLDAIDTMICSGEKDIIYAFKSFGEDEKFVLVEGDRWCFPHWGLKPQIDAMPHTESAYRYVCAGVIMARTDVLYRAIEEILFRRAACPHWMPGYDDDQGWWTISLVNKWSDIVVDELTRLSLSLNRAKLWWFERDNGSLAYMGNRTCIVHFCGGAKSRKIKTFLRENGYIA